MVQQLGLCALTAEGTGSIPGRGTKIPSSHVAWPKKESNTERQVLDRRKCCFIEEASNSGEKLDSCPKEPTLHCQSGGRVLKAEFQGVHRLGQGAMCRNNTVSSNTHLEIGHGGLISVILIVLSTVNLQVQGWFVPISLRPVLGIMQDGAAYVMATVWSSCS